MRELSRRDVLAGAAMIAATGAAAPAAAMAPAPGDAGTEILLAGIADRLITEYPENATHLGIDTGKRAGLRSWLTDRSRAADDRRKIWAMQTVDRLRSIDRSTLSPGIALNVDVAEEAFRIGIAGWQFAFGNMAVLSGQNSYRNTAYTVTQQAGAFFDVPDFLDSKHIVAGGADAEAYLARLEHYADELTAEADRVDQERTAGIVPPDFILDIVLRQMAAARAEPIDQWGVVTTLRHKASLAGLSTRFAESAEAVSASKVGPALDRQIAALTRARSVATSDPGVWKFPDGEAYYAWTLRAGTTTTERPEEMHALGREQIAKIHAEMDILLKGQGLSQGSVGERMNALGKRPDLLFSNDEAGRDKLLAYLNGRIADIRTRLPRAFATLVEGKLVIKRVPPSIQDGAPLGYGNPGSIDGSVPGTYYINLKDTNVWPRFALPTLCYHEGFPGHVWQGEYANRVSLLRNYLAFNAYSEGWALYAEQLSDELGVYDGDPLGKLGYLQAIGFRACRLVVDTGIHAKRWSFAQASEWMAANTGSPSGKIKSELTRYCAMPGQACGYKMGHNAINMLRMKAQKRLGRHFDLKRFDDAMVFSGNVPLTLLERITDRYIEDTSGIS
jgi:uncharacterized protein (DUF885 family)